MSTDLDTTADDGGAVEAPNEKVKIRLGGGYRKLVSATFISNLGDGMSQIAYPWLASAVTRNPILVAIIFAAQRLPWLFFTLIAGVITDRVDRRKAMVLMDGLRFVFTLFVAFAVLGQQGTLPAPDEVTEAVGTRTGLYLMLIVATLLMGCAEVLRDNCGQTIMPAIVPSEHLERANGRMWSAESVANTFVGPLVGPFLLTVAFSLPFFVDAGSFFLAAALVAAIPGSFRAERAADAAPRESWRHELKEGFNWLWHHPLFRAMAIILGLMNMASMVSGSMIVLFAQDVLGVTPKTFVLMSFGFAVGGILGGFVAPWLSKKLGSGTCLAMTLGASAVTGILVGFTSHWPVVALIYAIGTLLGSTWNVITVSLRQSVIPAHLLGRVNSVYRFFAWGMMPIGAALGGVIVVVAEQYVSHELALRTVFWVDGGIYFMLFLVGRRLLTTEKLEAVRASAAPPPDGTAILAT
ncbi:MAG TPA: MFS transporter [Ilumatobacteraceae bacterium]|nr:MFS transporter [Ilumatobacteraceae bacterium]